MRTARGCGHCGCGREPSATWGRRVPRTAARTDLGPIQPSSPAPAGGGGPNASSLGARRRVPDAGWRNPAGPLCRATRLAYCLLRTCVLDPDAVAIGRSKTDAPLTPKVNEPPHAWGPPRSGTRRPGQASQGRGPRRCPWTSGVLGRWTATSPRLRDRLRADPPRLRRLRPQSRQRRGRRPAQGQRECRDDRGPTFHISGTSVRVSVRGERHWVEFHATHCPGHSE